MLLTAREATEDTKTVTVIQNRIDLSVVIEVQNRRRRMEGEMHPPWKWNPIYETELFML